MFCCVTIEWLHWWVLMIVGLLDGKKSVSFCYYTIVLHMSTKFFNLTDRFTKGIYAISVAGRLPPNFVREMKARGIPYRPRDTTFK